MKRNRKILGMFIPVAVAAMTLFSSCSDEVLLESINTRAAEFIVTNDQWYVDSNDELRYDCPWDALTDDAITYGNVEAYKYENVNGVEHQMPLPYLYPVSFNNGTIYQPLNVRFDIAPGVISFVVADVGDITQYLTAASELLTMRFRVVVTVPVNYILER